MQSTIAKLWGGWLCLSIAAGAWAETGRRIELPPPQTQGGKPLKP